MGSPGVKSRRRRHIGLWITLVVVCLVVASYFIPALPGWGAGFVSVLIGRPTLHCQMIFVHWIPDVAADMITSAKEKYHLRFASGYNCIAFSWSNGFYSGFDDVTRLYLRVRYGKSARRVLKSLEDSACRRTLGVSARTVRAFARLRILPDEPDRAYFDGMAIFSGQAIKTGSAPDQWTVTVDRVLWGRAQPNAQLLCVPGHGTMEEGKQYLWAGNAQASDAEPRIRQLDEGLAQLYLRSLVQECSPSIDQTK